MRDEGFGSLFSGFDVGQVVVKLLDDVGVDAGIVFVPAAVFVDEPEHDGSGIFDAAGVFDLNLMRGREGKRAVIFKGRRVFDGERRVREMVIGWNGLAHGDFDGAIVEIAVFGRDAGEGFGMEESVHGGGVVVVICGDVAGDEFVDGSRMIIGLRKERRAAGERQEAAECEDTPQSHTHLSSSKAIAGRER